MVCTSKYEKKISKVVFIHIRIICQSKRYVFLIILWAMLLSDVVASPQIIFQRKSETKKKQKQKINLKQTSWLG